MEFQDYYAVLEVAPDADEQAIKQAYRQLARRYHLRMRRRIHALQAEIRRLELAVLDAHSPRGPQD
jgi:DnaJ-class molecular chaperone